MANHPLTGQDAPGLGPVLDLLGKMESQVGGIARGEAADSSSDEELRTLREELLSADQRGYEQLARFSQALEDLKQAIPSLIDETVNNRFLEIEDAFHRNVKEIHTRSIDAFTQSVQSKIGQRIAALENNLSIHTEAMGQLREHYLKTDRNVQRLMSGLDRLTAELMRLSSSAATTAPPRTIYMPGATRLERPERVERTERYDPRPFTPPEAPAPPVEEEAAAVAPPKIRKERPKRPTAILIPVLIGLILIPLGLIAWQLRTSGGLAGIRSRNDVKTTDAAPTGVTAQLHTAADFAAEKDYAAAENTYRAILRGEPANRDAIKGLASVLFRQQRYEESAVVLKTLPPE
jgi:tetratricopeptide (TPR) repeat protein